MKASTKDILRELKKSKLRFFYICSIIALGVAFFVGIKATSPSMAQTAYDYFIENKLSDFRLLSTYGFRPEDIKTLSEVDGVEEAVGAYSMDVVMQIGDQKDVIKIMSMPDPDGLNEPVLVDGRYPISANECVIETPTNHVSGFEIGQTIKVLDESRTPEDLENLNEKEFTIVGYVQSPQYVSIERGNTNIGDGTIDGYILVPKDAFAYERFTEAYVYTDVSAQGTDPYSDEYSEAQDQIIASLEKVGDKILNDNVTDIKVEALKEINKAQDEYDTNKAEFDRQIASAQAQINSGQKELNDGFAQYYEGLNTYNTQMAAAENTLNSSQQQINAGYISYLSGRDLLNNELFKAEQEILDGKTQLEAGKLSYSQGVLDFNNKISQAESDLRKAEQELLDGTKQYQTALETFNQQIAQAEAELSASEAEFNKGYDQFLQQEEAFYDQINSAQVQLDVGWNEYNNQLSQFNAQYQEFTDEINAAQNEINTQKTQLEEIQNKLSGLKTNYDDISNQLQNPDLTEEQKAELILQQNELQEQISALEPIVEQMSQAIIQAQNELDAKKAAGEEQFAPAKQQLEASYNELNSQQQALNTEKAKGEAQLNAARESLLAAKKQLEDARAEFEAQKVDGQAQLDSTYQILQQGQKDLEDGKLALEQNRLDGLAQLEEALKQLEDSENTLLNGELLLNQKRAEGEAQLNAALAELENGQAQINAGWTELNAQKASGLAQLNSSYNVLVQAERELNLGLSELNSKRLDGERQLADAQEQILDAREEIDNLDDGEWYVYSRDDNPGYTGYQEDSERIDTLGNVFPLFFFLVAALVAFTTMTRMVEEERTQIGTLYALGFSRWQIVKKYVIYAGAAAIIGATLGWIFGVFFLPALIFNAYSILYQLPDLVLTIPWHIVLISYLVALLCTVGAALIIAFSELKNVPAELMRPKAPKPGKRILLERITPIWNRLSFISKVSARNIFRYKTRFFMTVIGIAGCCALILAGFGLHDAIFTIIPNQFGPIFKYDESLIVNDPSYDISEEIAKVTADERVSAALAADQQSITLQTDSGPISVYLIVPEKASEIGDFIGLHERTEPDTPIELNDDGVVVSEKLATNYNARPGESITLEIDNRQVEAKVEAQTENYLQNYIYMSPTLFKELTGSDPDFSVILVNFTDNAQDAETQEAFATEMINSGLFTSAVNTTSIQDTSAKMLQSLNIVVIVMILSAGILAFIVLNNLTNINISERIREIATLKVLGFRSKETNNYIFRENLILSVFGVVLGLILGVLLLKYIIFTVELDIIMFGRTINIMSYIYAIVLTIGFTIVVNYTMIPVMNRVNMVESLKDID